MHFNVCVMEPDNSPKTYSLLLLAWLPGLYQLPGKYTIALQVVAVKQNAHSSTALRTPTLALNQDRKMQSAHVNRMHFERHSALTHLSPNSIATCGSQSILLPFAGPSHNHLTGSARLYEVNSRPRVTPVLKHWPDDLNSIRTCKIR